MLIYLVPNHSLNQPLQLIDVTFHQPSQLNDARFQTSECQRLTYLLTANLITYVYVYVRAFY